MSGELSHDVRVLACGNCGAPNSVPVQGGLVQCGHCRAGLQVIARREPSLARQRPIEPLDEIHRRAILATQDGLPLLPPKSVSSYFSVGGIAPGKMDAALESWRVWLNVLRDGHDVGTEEQFYFLTRLVADRLWTHQKHLEARALLESAAEVLRARRYRQVVYCMLSRRAALLGDAAAANAWIAPCDPAPYDLQMDSELRQTRAFSATLAGDYEAVIQHLGASAKDLPIADYSDALATAYRANALERTRGVDAAVEELLRPLETDIFAFLDFQDIRAGAPIELCPQSFPQASRRVPVNRKKLGCEPIGCLGLFVVVEAPMVINLVFLKQVWFDSATATWVVPLVLAVLLLPFIGLQGWIHFQLGRQRAERRAARPGSA